jgi:hypothetical protein
MRTSKGKKSSSPRRRSSEARALRALPSKVIPNKKRYAPPAWLRGQGKGINFLDELTPMEDDDG